jgi:hypothetical protein
MTRTPIRHKIILTVGLSLGFLAFLGLLVTIYQMITAGKGIQEYVSGHGVQRNYIGTAITIGIAIIIGIVAGVVSLFRSAVRWYQGREDNEDYE